LSAISPVSPRLVIIHDRDIISVSSRETTFAAWQESEEATLFIAIAVPRESGWGNNEVVKEHGES
jgi:hypothetical protein